MGIVTGVFFDLIIIVFGWDSVLAAGTTDCLLVYLLSLLAVVYLELHVYQLKFMRKVNLNWLNQQL